jgi:hypothetical protein
MKKVLVLLGLLSVISLSSCKQNEYLPGQAYDYTPQDNNVKH